MIPAMPSLTATLAAWLHDIDPYAIQLWEGGPVRWYGLSYLLGFAIGYMLMRRVVRVGKSAMSVWQVGDLFVALAVGVVVGGRLGYVFFYKPALLWTFFEHLPYWGVLAINEGGMASHGGMLGGIAAACWFAHRRGLDWAFVLDLFAFGAPLGLFFGRVANFVNGELIGRKASESLPWAVKFPQEMYSWPVSKLEQLMATWQDQHGGTALFQTPKQFVHHVITRIQAGDAQVAQMIEPILAPRHPSQLYAAVLEGLVVFAVLLWIWRKPRLPGVVACWFAISYAAMRIVDEIWRRPDVHLMDDEFQWLGVTRGQWLSALLLLAAVGLLWWVCRRGKDVMGSWRRGDWTAVEDVDEGDERRKPTA